MQAAREILIVHQGKSHASDNKAYLMPMGLISMAERLCRTEHPTEILHLPLERALDPEHDLGAEVRTSGASWVCFDLHWHQQSRTVIETAREVRRGAPNAKIVLGGYTASAFDLEILRRFDCVDFVIRGDAELALGQLVEAVAAGTPLHRVSNLTYRLGGEVHRSGVLHVNDADDLGRYTYAAFEHVRHHRYYTQAGIMEGELNLKEPFAPGIFYCNCGRGCPYDCTFCGGGREAQRLLGGRERVVYRPVEAMLADLRRMEEHNLDTWYNTFHPSDDESYFLTLFDQIHAEGLGLRMIHECLHLPSQAFLERFAKTFAPRSHLDFVLLTASDELRRKNKENYFSRADLEACLGRLEDLGIQSGLCFLTGLPFEEAHHVRASIDFAQEVGHRFPLANVTAELLTIEPLAPMNRDPEHHAIRSHAQTFEDYYQGHAGPFFSGYEPGSHTAEEAIRAASEIVAAHRLSKSKPATPRRLVQLHDIRLWDDGWHYGLGAPSLISFAEAQPGVSERYTFEHRAWKAGHPTDPDPTPAAIADAALRANPRLVGFTLTTWSIETLLAAARLIRRDAPSIAIAAGGPMAADASADLLSCTPELDYVVHGYGEEPFTELLHALADDTPEVDALAAIAGLYFRDGDEIRGTNATNVLSPDAVPSPYRAGWIAPDPGNTMHVEWSRGCPANCGYCSWGNAHHAFVLASPERIGDDIAWAIEHEVPELTLNSAAINYRTDTLAELCDAVIKGTRGRSLQLTAFLRYEHLDEEQLELLRPVPFKRLIMGLQSDDDDTLRAIGRPPLDRERFEWAVERIGAFTRPGIQIITALPGDTYDRFCRRLQYLLGLDADLTVFPLQTPPGSRMFRQRERLGIQPDPAREYFVFGTDSLTPREHGQCLGLAERLLAPGASARARDSHGVSAPARFWSGLREVCHQGRPLVQLHQANVNDAGMNFGLGVPFVIAHCRTQPDLNEKFEFQQVAWEVDAPDLCTDPLQRMVDAVVHAAPAVAGFSLQPWCYDRFLDVIRQVRQRAPDVFLVVGGANAIIEGGTLLQDVPELDAVVASEGERPFAALLRALMEPDLTVRRQQLASIGSLWTRVGDTLVGGVSEEVAPETLDYCGDPLGAGLVQLTPGNSHLNLEWTRGCPNQCTYCIWSRRERSLRRFSRTRITSDVHWAIAQGFTEISICDAAINYDDTLLSELCETLVAADPQSRLRFSCFLQWPLFNEAQLEMMRPVRWSRVMVGLQTDDPAGLKVLGRPVHDQVQLERCVRLLQQITNPYVDLLTGIPGDTADKLRQRLHDVLALGCCVSMFPLLAMKGTPLQKRCLERGCTVDATKQHAVTSLPTMSHDEYRDLITELSSCDLASGVLEISGYHLLWPKGTSAQAGYAPAGAQPQRPGPVAPGAPVFLHQAFKCCPYAAMITAQIHDFFVANGHLVAEHPEQAELSVINTCGFNASRSSQAIAAIGVIRKRAPDQPVVVAGCLTKIERDRLGEALDGGPPWLLVGPGEHDQFNGLVAAPQPAFADVATNLYNEHYSRGDPRLGLFQVLVSTGCLNRCTYCVIRKAKGTVVSKPLDEIVREVRRGASLGHGDVFLVGDDISSWGTDQGTDLVTLLTALSQLEGDMRFSAEAFEPSLFLVHIDALLPLFATGRFSWIVLPVQSGSNRVLEAMGRHYKRAQMETAVSRIKEAAPQMIVSTDFIFGFAEETREEFEASLDLARLFDYANFNEYEQRPGTAPQAIEPRELQHRRNVIEAFLSAQGSQQEVLTKNHCTVFAKAAGPPDRTASASPVQSLVHDPGAASAWARAQAPRLDRLVDQRGRSLGAGWQLAPARPDHDRVVLPVRHAASERCLSFMVTPRDGQRPAIAFSDEYNLALIWDEPTECLLDDEQIGVLEALVERLGLSSNDPQSSPPSR